MDQYQNLKASPFGGYDKKSVLSYLDEINLKSYDMEKSFSKRLEELSSSNEELTKKCESISGELSSLGNQLENERKHSNELTKELDELNLNMLSQKKVEHELKKELDIKREKNKELCDQVKNYGDKANKYDETAIEVGSLLVDAKQSAQKIIDQALVSANDIKEITQKNARNVTIEIRNFKNDVENLRTTINDVVCSISTRLDVLVSSVDEIEKRCHCITATFEEEKAKDETISNEKVSVEKEKKSSRNIFDDDFSIYKNELSISEKPLPDKK